MYATILYFDENTEETINRVWTKLSETNISNYHIDKNGSKKRPHITLADYEFLDLAHYEARFNRFFADKSSLDIDFSMLGSFPKGGTLFLAPTITEALLHLHTDYHKAFSAYRKDKASYYLPGKWVPHLTISNRLSHENLAAAFDLVGRTFEPIRARISEVVLIKILYENGVAAGSETVMSYQFTGS